MSSKNTKFVLGVDFGAVPSGIRITYIEIPSLKFTVDEWGNEDDNKSKKTYPTSILYKADENTLCGNSNTTHEDSEKPEKNVN